MAYKKYIKKRGKIYGPYIYHSKKINGRVITEYLGKGKEKTGKNKILIISLAIIFFLSLFSFLNHDYKITNFLINEGQSENSNFVFIKSAIPIINAEHLNSNKEFILDIYEQVKTLDDIWSEPINDSEYVRVTFEQNLTKDKDITLYPRIVSGSPIIEVYEKDGNEKIAEFNPITSNDYNKIYLTNLQNSQDTFDLRVSGGSLEFDYIVDPQAQPGGGGIAEQVELRAQNCTANNNSATATGYASKCNGVYPSNTCANNGDRLSCDDYPINETQNAGAGQWGGVKTHIYNATITDCQSITQVFACYNWWVSGTATTVYVAIGNGTTEFNISTTTPGTTVDPAVTCVNVTSSLTWSCNNFFGSTGKKAYIRNDFTRSASARVVYTDLLMYNVTYQGPDTVKPDIQIIYPSNNTNSSNAGLNINYTIADDVGISDCWYSNNSGKNNNTLINCANITGTTWLQGINNVTIWVNDTSNNVNSSSVTFTIDTIKPNLQVVYPSNNTNTTNTGIDVNYTASDSGVGLSACWYSNTSGLVNYTLAGCGNITGVNWLEGTNNVTIWANDTVNNINSSSVTFTIDTTLPYFTNLANQIITTSESLNYDINAADDGVGLGSFAINWTSNFIIVASTGVLTNTSGLSLGDYYINISVNDTLGNLNSSILKVSVISADSVPPNVTSLTETPADGVAYSPGAIYQFNTTILDISTISKVLLEFNGVNYTASTTGNNVYNATIQNLPAGNFNYRWFANDSLGNTNNTEAGTYAINQNTTPCNIYFNATSPLTYGKKFLVLTNCSSSFSMYRNGTLVSNGSEQDLAAAVGYNFTVIRNDRSNYTNIAQEAAFTVSKATSAGSLASTKGWSYTYDNLATTISYSETNNGDADVTYKIFRNNVDKGSGETVNLAVGVYSYILNSTGGQNYSATAGIDSQTLTISKAIPTGLVSGTSPITYGTASDVQGTESNTGDADLIYNLFRDNALVSNPDASALAAGSYNYIYNTTGGANYSASASLDTFSLTVNKAIPQGSLISSNGWTLNYGQGTTIGISETNAGDADLTYSVFRDNVNVGTGPINLSVGTYSYKLNTTGGTNYTINSSMNTQTLTINQIASSINLTLKNVQGNASINEDTSIDLNCSKISGDSGAMLRLYNNGTLINQGSSLIGNTTTFNTPATYNITCIYVATTNFSQSSETWWLKVNDTTPPYFTNLANQTVPETNPLNYDIDAQDDGVGLGSFAINWTSNFSIVASTGVLTNTSKLAVREYYINVSVNDSVGNMNSGTLLVNVTEVDIASPSATINSPLNKSYSTNSITFNITAIDNTLISSCLYTLNNGFTNYTLSQSGTNNYIAANSTMSQGTHKVIYYCNDTSNNLNNTESVSFFVDSINPDIAITYPSNNTNTTNTGIDVNYTRSDANLQSCWYSNDTFTVNTTLANCGNITAVIWSEGKHNVTIWANDTANNVNSSSVTFTIDTTAPYFTNLANTTIAEGTSLSYDINAQDDGVGLGSFAINWTTTFSIVPTTGVLTNTSGLSLRIYWINVSVNDTLGNRHSGVFYMNVSEIVDLDYPQFSGFVSIPDNASIYTSGQVYRFNSTITSNNGSVGLEFNGVNYTATNVSDNFTVSINDLAGGTYSYYWWAYGNGTLKNFNYTQDYYYAINKSSDTSLTKYLNGINNNITIAYPQQLNATASSTQGTIKVYRNGADVTGENGLNISLSAGYYEYKFNITGNSNYTDIGGEFLYANITKANGLAYLYINGTRSNFSSERLHTTRDVWLNATLTSGIGNIELWVNGTLYNNGTSPLSNLTNLSQGFYNVTSKYRGNANYTFDEEVYWINISLNTPLLEILSPKNETYFENTSLLLNYSASSSIGLDFVKYNIDSGENTTISSAIYFNISAGSHSIYLYANNSNGVTTKNVSFLVNLTSFSIAKDKWTGSTKGNSTNFNSYSYSEIQNLSNITLENTQFGKIFFNEPINMTSDTNFSDNQLNLDEYINISSNKIEINSTALPNFNKSATLYLYNLTFTNPRILRNGEICPGSICTKESYSSGSLRFSVTQFTTYSTGETPTEAETEVSGGTAAAGGGTGCNNNDDCKENEVCWKKACVKLFDIKIINFTSPAKLGEFFDFTYFVKGMANINDDVEINFWIEQGGKIVTSGSDVIYLGSFEEKTETTKIFLPTDMKSGVYEFYVEVVNQEYNVKSYRTIEIEVKEGIVKISPINTRKIETYILISALILFALILSIILHAERKKIKGLFMQERIFIKKHKNSVLMTLLFVIFGVIIYYSGLFSLIVKLISNIPLWFKINILSYLLEVVLVTLALIGLIAILIISRKKWFKHWKRGVRENLKKKARLLARSVKKRKEKRELIKRREEAAKRRQERIKEKERERKEFAREFAKRKEESIKKAKEKLKEKYHGLLSEKELALLKDIQNPKEKKRLNPKELALLKDIQSRKEKKDL